MTNGKKVGEALGAIALGVIGGLIAASIINYLLDRPKCPVCKKQIPRRALQCPYCKSYLEWE